MGLALEESLKDQDLLEENNGVSFVYEKGIAHYVDDRIIDFQPGAQGGFSIRSASGMTDCCGDCESGC